MTELEVDRQEEHHREEARGKDRDEHHRASDRLVAKEIHREKRRLVTALVPEEHAERNHRGRKQREACRGGEAEAMAHGGEPEKRAHRADREKQVSGNIAPFAARRMLGPRRQAK